MDLFIALGIFGALLFWVFIITRKPADTTFIENHSKGARSSGASLSEQRAGDQHPSETNTAPMGVGGDVAAPLKTTGHTVGRDRPMPEVLAEIRKANAAAMSPFGQPPHGDWSRSPPGRRPGPRRIARARRGRSGARLRPYNASFITTSISKPRLD